MTGFPKNSIEVSAAFQEGRKKGFFPSSGALLKCLENHMLYYQETGLPHRKQEGWRYFPFERVLKAGYQFLESSGVKELTFSGKERPPVVKNSTVLPIKNGRVSNGFKMEGLKVLSWREFLKGESGLKKGWTEKMLEILSQKRDSLASLNNLFSREGLILLIEKNLKTPLEIQFLQETFSEQKGLPFRLFIFIRENCRADILETFYGSASEDVGVALNGSTPSVEGDSESLKKSFLLHLQTDCLLEKKSSLNYIRLDQGHEKDVLLNQFFGSMDEESEGCFLTVSLHSGLSRYETYLKQNRKSRSEVRGLSLVDKRRLTEHRVCVSHLEEEGFSNQLYQSLVFDSAKHIFHGLIHIARKAQKTEAYQLNRNLLLGEKAFSVSCPELNVLADDVQAQHGASVSSLEESREIIFYLQSRGLSYKKSLELVLSDAVWRLLSIMGENIKSALLSLVLNSLKEKPLTDLR